MLAQFLWNWVKLCLIVGPEEVYIINAIALHWFFFRHAPEEESIKPKNFKRLIRSSISPIWAIRAGSGGIWALIGGGEAEAANKLVR